MLYPPELRGRTSEFHSLEDTRRPTEPGVYAKCLRVDRGRASSGLGQRRDLRRRLGLSEVGSHLLQGQRAAPTPGGPMRGPHGQRRRAGESGRDACTARRRPASCSNFVELRREPVKHLGRVVKRHALDLIGEGSERRRGSGLAGGEHRAHLVGGCCHPRILWPA